MITSLLVANRGEIACRIIRTCRELGIRTVAVFSEADADARHAGLADEKHCIGAPEARSSYLDAGSLMAAAVAHRVDAIHPGYGFLSESPILPDLCEKSGLVWIGPSARCIKAMGSKNEAKRLADEAGVPGVPGFDGTGHPADRLLREASEIGFPLLIKASAGGGGKGMRLVHNRNEFHRALELARSEARAAFGDDGILLERFIPRPRHIEVQLAGDKHGNVIHLFERECSIQRNYQKVVEEAPASGLSRHTRDKLFDNAVRLGRAIGYDSVGTVEFLLDADAGEDAEPYFLEMNTRLQVEHPVTEMIMGIDLVALQVAIAAGERLPMCQDDIRSSGHAIEVRLTAEDPAAGYSPGVGSLSIYREPEYAEGIRVDSGVKAGSNVTPYYDSLLAKLIVSGPDRDQAVRRLQMALDRFVIQGVPTNRELLRSIVRNPEFRHGRLTTRFIPDAFPGGYVRQEPDDRAWAAAAIAVLFRREGCGLSAQARHPWTRFAGFRVLGQSGQPACLRYKVGWENISSKDISLKLFSRERIIAELDDVALELDVSQTQQGFSLGCRERVDQVLCSVEGSLVFVDLEGRSDRFSIQPLITVLAEQDDDHQSAGSQLRAVMSGAIVSVDVLQGQAVTADQVLVVLEAMKLMHAITAPVAGIVTRVHCEMGDVIATGAPLVDIEPEVS